ncbi:hypothetical protein BDY17DRAFT_300166 [Neohortaea acidophila]|uniref:F-box domain-containing protein n=1 Tax=Neohortaea acidophila TaxID=245834 RepID=A0A6A6PS56_9PEZI|nr:uncharacterized protein BDY17DRAFT_300166 [Neohortaea acidophila]KAF2482047.1 hypothetical protein BDY17DRAFT_300166 [Neohortaea acidophila]
MQLGTLPREAQARLFASVMASQTTDATPAVAEHHKPADGEDHSKPMEEFTIVGGVVPRSSRKAKVQDDDEPLIDTTVAIPKRSKKTERAQRRLAQKQQKRPHTASLLDLPAELVEHILGFLLPSDIFRLLSINRSIHDFIKINANAIARDIIHRRFWVLSRCFPLPVPLEKVDSSAYSALLSEKRDNMLRIHKKSYQHVKEIDPLRVCTCLNCILAWNDLNLVLDLAHWQDSLDKREPITMIKRGTHPDWNRKLLEANAAIVEKAMEGDLLCYAMIFQKHLHSTTRTLLRTYRGKKTVHPKRLYHITAADAAKGDDEFLERSGPPSHEFPYHRDKYYDLEAYIPNRRWLKDRAEWTYYAKGLHNADLQWIIDRFSPQDPNDNVSNGAVIDPKRHVDVK